LTMTSQKGPQSSAAPFGGYCGMPYNYISRMI
jgi:hypothetical protein